MADRGPKKKDLVTAVQQFGTRICKQCRENGGEDYFNLYFLYFTDGTGKERMRDISRLSSKLLNKIACHRLKDIVIRSCTQDCQRQEFDTWLSLLFDSASLVDKAWDRNLTDFEEKVPDGASTDRGTNRRRNKDKNPHTTVAEGELQDVSTPPNKTGRGGR